MSNPETRPDIKKAEYMAWGGKPLRDMGKHEQAEKVENTIGYQIDLFRHVKTSTAINHFSQQIEHNLFALGTEGLLTRGFDRVRTWPPEGRYHAYEDSQPGRFETNMLQLLETIAITAAEKEIGLIPRRRKVLLTNDTTDEKHLTTHAEYLALSDIVRTAAILGIDEIVDNISNLGSTLASDFDIPNLPLGIRIKFDMMPAKTRNIKTGKYAIPYAVATISSDQKIERRKI